MDFSLLISGIAVLLAALSLYYARQSVDRAKRANKIALQAERVRIYKGLYAFTRKFSRAGREPTDTDISDVAEWALLAELYFPRRLSDPINLKWRQAWVIVEQLSMARDPGYAEAGVEYDEAVLLDNLYETGKALSTAVAAIRDFLRVEEA